MGGDTKIHDTLYELTFVNFFFQQYSEQYPTCDSMVKAGYSKNIKPGFRRGRKLDGKTDVAHYGKAKLEVEKDGYMITAGNK